MDTRKKAPLMFKIKVPVKPHLKKFLLHYYKQEPITGSRDDMMGIILYSILEREHHNMTPDNWKRPGEQIEFSVPAKYIERSGFFISNYNVSLINNYLDSLFRFLFFNQIFLKLDGKEPLKGFYKREAKTFLRFYNIEEDDLTLESFLKDLYRKRKESDDFLRHNCPLQIRSFQVYSHSK